MLLFRGQNTDAPFEATDSRNQMLGGDNGAVYFMGFNKRNSALVYALTNFSVFEDDEFFDEGKEWVDEGVFYKCSYNQSSPQMLDDIPLSDVPGSLSKVYDSINAIDDSLFVDKAEFLDFVERFDSAYELIVCVNEIRNDYEISKEDFHKIIAPILDESGTSIARSIDNGEVINDEFVVYRTSDIQVLKKVPVFKSDIKRHNVKDLTNVSVQELIKKNKKHVDETVLSR